MAVLVGNAADIYIATASGTSMTGEAVTSLGSGVYQITNATKRAINPNATLTVLDGVSTVPAQNYQVNFGSGKIRLTNGYTLGGTMTVTGQYLTLAQAAQGHEWSLDVDTRLADSTTFGNTWKESTAVLNAATVNFNRFYNDEYFLTNIGNYYVLALYVDLAGNDRFLCGASLKSVGVTASENDLVKEGVQFEVHGALDFAAS